MISFISKDEEEKMRFQKTKMRVNIQKIEMEIWKEKKYITDE